MNTRRSVWLAAAGAPVLLWTAPPAGATTDEPTTLHVEGTQTQVSESLYRSEGGLLGDFWVLTLEPLYQSDSLLIATGSERFVGCVDVDLDRACGEGEPSGELRFDYVQWTTFDPSTGALVEGNCVHPITGGRDSFVGARGLVTMHDVPVDGEVRTTYQGAVVLNAVPEEPPALQAQAAQAFAADVASIRAGHC